MQLIQKIENVWSTHAVEDDLIYRVGKVYKFYNSDLPDILVEEESDQLARAVFTRDREFLGAVIRKEGYSIIGVNGKLFFKSDRTSLIDLQSSYLLDYNRETKITRLISIPKFEIVNEINIWAGFYSTFGGIAYGKDFYTPGLLYGLDVNNGNIVFSYSINGESSDLPETVENRNSYYSIHRILGVCDNTLIILLHGSIIIGVDLLTHRKKYEFLYPHQYPESFKLFQELQNHHNRHLYLDNNTNKLIGQNGQFYLEIDLLKKQENYLVFDVSDELLKNNLAPASSGLYKWPLHDSLLYFGHSDASPYLNNIGTLNMQTKSITNAMSVGVSDLSENFGKLKYRHPGIVAMDFINKAMYIHIGRYRNGQLYKFALE